MFSDGYYLKGSWSKGESEDPIILTTESGEVLKLAIGKHLGRDDGMFPNQC